MDITKRKKTKIVATLGPETDKLGKEGIRKMIELGANVFRLNYSHVKKKDGVFDFSEIENRIRIVRELNQEMGTNVGILADLQGPKIRVGQLKKNPETGKEEYEVKVGDIVEFVCEGKSFEDGDNKRVYMYYQQFASDVNVGDILYVNDGKLKLKAIETDKSSFVKAEVLEGGVWLGNKGVNLPGTKISSPALTEKDKRDALHAISQNVDWIALSFVREKADIDVLRKIIEENSQEHIPIISKIEKPEAMMNLIDIMTASDGVMVARGDLGVETDPARVPYEQKRIVNLARKMQIPVIVATQMLDSMENSTTPTRAEVNDVANSVIDGADAVMLSAETANGKNPLKAVEIMARIIRNSEELILTSEKPNVTDPNVDLERQITIDLCYHSVQMVDSLRAKAIVTLTNSGYTAAQISSYRPKVDILTFTRQPRVATRLSLMWGVTTFVYEKNFDSVNQTIETIMEIAKQKQYIKEGEPVVNLVSMPIDNDNGKVNTIRVTFL